MPVFEVKVKDRATDKEQVLTVSGKATQKEAEEFVTNMPRASGGGHPGFEVIPAETTPANPAPAAPIAKIEIEPEPLPASVTSKEIQTELKSADTPLQNIAEKLAAIHTPN